MRLFSMSKKIVKKSLPKKKILIVKKRAIKKASPPAREKSIRKGKLKTKKTNKILYKKPVLGLNNYLKNQKTPKKFNKPVLGLEKYLSMQKASGKITKPAKKRVKKSVLFSPLSFWREHPRAFIFLLASITTVGGLTYY